MITVVTGRFNNETLNRNYEYRNKYGFKCLYSCPSELSPKIPYNTPVFVIEMNNSLNQIEGIGLIKNKVDTKKYYKVHSDANTNRYTYIGNYFLDRETIEKFNPLLLSILDDILFKGKTHSKRGSGLTLIPEKVLKLDIFQGLDIKKNIRNLFISKFRENLELENKDNL